jgi:tetratricopeptide (TPR) repeat protein
MTAQDTARRFKILLAENNFDQVLRELSQLERERDLTPRELVIRSRCIQLSSGGSDMPPLEEAEKSLREAIEKDDEYTPAIIDLAWYYYSVEDDPARALPLFELAYKFARQDIIESIKGKVEALEELKSVEEAAKSLYEALQTTLRLEDFDDEKKGWLKNTLNLSL